LWAALKQKVYNGGRRKFNTLDELRGAIKNARDELASGTDYAQRLAVAASEACLEVYRNDGEKSKWNRPTGREEWDEDHQLNSYLERNVAVDRLKKFMSG
jgi:hypothetical protein